LLQSCDNAANQLVLRYQKKTIHADLAATESKVRKFIVEAAFNEILEDKKNDGVCNYGEYTATINRYCELGHHWLTRQLLTYRMERYTKQ
jgi:hypothetical protein